MTRRRYRHRLAVVHPSRVEWSEILVVEGDDPGRPGERRWWIHAYWRGVRAGPGWEMHPTAGADLLNRLIPAHVREEVASE